MTDLNEALDDGSRSEEGESLGLGAGAERRTRGLAKGRQKRVDALKAPQTRLHGLYRSRRLQQTQQLLHPNKNLKLNLIFQRLKS